MKQAFDLESLSRAFLCLLAIAGVQTSYAQASSNNDLVIAVPPRLAPVATYVLPDVIHRSIPVSGLSDSETMQFSVSFASKDPQGFEEFVDAVSDRRNPLYGKYLTPAQVGERFGADPVLVAQAKTYFESCGLTVTLSAENGLAILVQGSAAKASRALGVTFANFYAIDPTEPGRLQYYAPTETPQLPLGFVDQVIDIGGIESFTKPMARAITAAQTRTLYRLASLYNGGLRGQGRSIGISNWDGFRLSNLPLYYSANGLPTPTGGVGSNVKVVKIGTGSGAGTPVGEGDLDIQMVLGMAPLANVTVYDGTTDLVSVLTKEASDNSVEIITESWGWKLSASSKTAAHNQHLAMSAQGITYIAASGDTGTTLEPYSYPNFEPEVLMVGGTVATTDTTGVRKAEVAWSGSGGGYSLDTSPFNTRPGYQREIMALPNVDKRLTPDISFHAAGSGAYPFYLNGKVTSSYSGTSFAAPIFAGMLAVGQQKLVLAGYFGTAPTRLGRIHNLIYDQKGRSDVYMDIVTGGNGLLSNGESSLAQAGWDTVTGWGAIDIDDFVASLIAAGRTPATYQATAVSIYSSEGKTLSGTVASFLSLDGDDYEVNSLKKVTVGSVAAATITFAVPTAEAGPLTLELSATGPAGAVNEVYAYNFKTRIFDLVQKNTLSGLSQGIKVPVASLSNYASAGAVRLVVRMVNPPSTGGAAFIMKIDKALLWGP